MDRFIVYKFLKGCEKMKDLKSNMDRFIVWIGNNSVIFLPYLKSNMDRFIALEQLEFFLKF